MAIKVEHKQMNLHNLLYYCEHAPLFRAQEMLVDRGDFES